MGRNWFAIDLWEFYILTRHYEEKVLFFSLIFSSPFCPSTNRLNSKFCHNSSQHFLILPSKDIRYSFRPKILEFRYAIQNLLVTIERMEYRGLPLETKLNIVFLVMTRLEYKTGQPSNGRLEGWSRWQMWVETNSLESCLLRPRAAINFGKE